MLSKEQLSGRAGFPTSILEIRSRADPVISAIDSFQFKNWNIEIQISLKLFRATRSAFSAECVLHKRFCERARLQRQVKNAQGVQPARPADFPGPDHVLGNFSKAARIFLQAQSTVSRFVPQSSRQQTRNYPFPDASAFMGTKHGSSRVALGKRRSEKSGR